ncbi:arylsulfotransferase family protein [Chelativorans sp. M5D2P16]|uniref:arylsulfotransferase family protein n=1 Tax=Chelativorans sp. M5D2P16 TaxID=3095678 RepID=UPI002ACA9922|nr:arylsulfotransferase family protein [Chelativorans sp. M5D2P16]MDZ5696214.1 arylsulfotransferase family protein [Chelativorans sp. M5D2P16]
MSVSDRIGPAFFALSFGVLAVIYGIVSAGRGWFPAPQVDLAYRTLLDLSTNWENDLALVPTRHLVAPGGANTGPDRGLSGAPAGASSEGYILIAGLSENQDESFHVVRLFDGTGQEVHRWPIRYELLDTEKKPQNVMLHGMEVFEDGSLAVTFDAGNAITRVDACGEPMWTRNGAFHHSIARDGEGRILTWQDETVVWLDERSGKAVRTLAIEGMIAAGGRAQQATFNIRTRTPENAKEEVRYLADPFHPNDAEPLRAEMADAFPMFEAGDVLISLRELNLIAVADPDTGRMKWWRHGPWFKQHDPDFQPGGTITVYDNGTGEGASRILRIRPGDDAVETVFAGSEAVPFYSWRRGKHQVLADGNILLTEAEGGRVLEVSPEGEMVWERHMVWDAEQNLIITEARHVPADFFENGVPNCAPS